MYEFGVDFIARCLAGEALEEARDNANHLVAGPNISIQHDAPNHQTVISNTMPVDDELSTTSENPVQNKVITNELKYKPDTYTGSTRTANQKIVQLTRAEYDAIDTKDPNTYYMITDDTSMTVRTAYVPLAPADYTTRMDGTNKFIISFDAPQDFELLEARISYRITFTDGWWEDATLSFTDTLSIPSTESDTPREGRKIYSEAMVTKWVGEAPNQVETVSVICNVTGSNYIRYNSTTGKIELEIGNITAGYINYYEEDPTNAPTAVISNVEILNLGYIAYGSDNINITTDSYRGGEDISITNGTINFTGNYGHSVEMTMDPDTYVVSLKLKDQNGVQLGSTQTIDLPLESVVVSGAYDSQTKTITLTLEDGSTISIPVADLVSGLQTELSASNKLDPAFIDYDSTHAAVTEAEKTAWNAIDGVPDVTSNDNGKILRATYSGGTGTYSWETETPFTQVQADWAETDNSAVDYIKNKPSLAAVATSGSYNDLSNKPTIPAAQVNADWNASSGVSEILNKPTFAAVATSGSYNDLSNKPTIPAAQVNADWNANSGVAEILNKPTIPTKTSELQNDSGFLTSVDEVPAVTSSDNEKVLTATYSGGVGSYSWETAPSGVPAAAVGTDDGKVLTADILGNPVWRNIPTPTDMATQTWVVNQGYLTSADEVPDVTSSDDGKVLTASYSGGTGSYSWQTPSGGGGGGLSVETDGTNYWITVNGIRLYFASSAPSGTIPTGSLGIGW